MATKTVLVTGGAGFVARHLIPLLMARGWAVRAVVRRSTDAVPLGAQVAVVGDILDADWDTHLQGVSEIVHLAGRAHRMEKSASDTTIRYQRDNVDVTAVLARAAIRANILRFVYISSVKAMGESTPIDRPWNEQSPCVPVDAYGRTKLAAEQELIRISRSSSLPIVILRPPLLYGAQVKANMLKLLSWVDRGLPLPLASVYNARSLLYVENFADAICSCLEHPRAVGKMFLLSDGEDLSTPELIRRLARARGRRSRLLPMSPKVLFWFARLLGHSSEADRLLGSLRIDSSKIRSQLGWTPPFTVDAGLRETALSYDPTGNEYSSVNDDNNDGNSTYKLV